MYPELTQEQIDCLRYYADAYGVRWRQNLIDRVWNNSRFNPQTDTETVLYGLRNSHGPAWLRKFSLPR